MSDVVSLSLLVLRCSDLERSRTFYEALGFRFTREQHDSGPAHYSSASSAAVVELYPKGKRSTSDLRFGLRLRQGSAVLDSVVELGGSVLSRQDVGETLRAVVLDPDGHTIELAFER